MVQMTPKNATQAMAQASRYERAKNLIAEGYSFTQDKDTEIVFVCKPGRLYAEYTIGEQLTGRDGCSCPDFQKNGIPCKHMMAWEGIQAEEADELAGLEAQCAAYDDAEGFLDRIPTPTLMSLAIKDLSAAMEMDLQKVNAAIANHGPRRSNFIQCQQEFDKAGRLENALVIINQYKTL